VTLPDRLRAPALAPVWRAVHDRLSSGRTVTSVRVGPLTAEEQGALADLLGLDRLPGEYYQLPISRLDAVLAEITGRPAGPLVVALLGPLDDRAGRRTRAEAERTELWRWLAGHPVVRGQPALTDWVDHVRRAGIQRSVPATRATLERALLVLAALPAHGQPLPAFANDVLADPHALDDGTRLSGLVLRALAAVYAVEVPGSAEPRRALWERAGVADDALSTVVVAAGLRPSGTDLASRILSACTEAGQAAAVTLAQLRSCPALACPDLVQGGAVRVVENPSLLAMALARFGRRCPPLVCTAGWPNSAGILLLRLLTAGGARLHYHGDFDGDGLRIAAYVLAKTAAVPWRMSAADYRAAVGRGAAAPGPPAGRLIDAPWDPELAAAMRTHNTVVPEESVAAVLLADLAQATGLAE
jgi:uncharacterized protein (TIGR02679 family)